MSLRMFLLAGVTGCAFAFPADAVVTSVYNNMAEATNPGLYSFAADPGAGGPAAQSFTTTSSTTTLQDISVLVSDSSLSTGSFVVTLLADSGGSPDFTDAPLWTSGTISDSAYSADANGYWSLTFTSTEGISLSQDTNYWVGLETADPSTPTDVSWVDAADGIGAQVPEYFYFSGAPYSSDGYPLVMSVSVNDAPEPTTLAVMGIGLAGIGVARRRLARGNK
jgi:PEP-CTERM motif